MSPPGHRVRITPRMRSRGVRVGTERQEFHDAKGTPNAYGLKGDPEKWLKVGIQGALAELVIATELGVADQWVECVEDYQELKGDVVDRLQVRSTTWPDGNLILHPKDDANDVFVLVRIDEEYQWADIQGWCWARDGKQKQFWPGKNPDRPCFMYPRRLLKPWPAPVWEGVVVDPHSNDNPAERGRAKTKHVNRKVSTKFPLTCPRCGWGATHLVSPSFQSKYAALGGLCSECCLEAASAYDKSAWPETMWGGEQVPAKAIERLTKEVFGLIAPKFVKKQTISEGQEALEV